MSILDTLKAGARAVGTAILGTIANIINAFVSMLKALATFIQSMLKSLYVGAGVKVKADVEGSPPEHGAYFILEFCFDMSGVFSSLMEAGHSAIREAEEDHIGDLWDAYKKQPKEKGDLASDTNGVEDAGKKGILIENQIEGAVGGEAKVEVSNAKEVRVETGEQLMEYIDTEEGKVHKEKENVDAHEKSDVSGLCLFFLLFIDHSNQL